MSTVSTAQSLIPEDAKLQNARRYDLTEDQMSQFSDLLKDAANKVAEGDNPDGQEASLDVDGEYIKDYVMDRLKNRLIQNSQYGSEYGDVNDFSSLTTLVNPQDFFASSNSTARDKANEFSSFLNSHFDLNTLQMLSNIQEDAPADKT
ncbi:MAG: hypothetical protein COB59_03995 [Rhodospirillaceae bacterium]|nr:MAG: hypothetical protein COB59_03995 [Rhodospirillaceae bacterium]